MHVAVGDLCVSEVREYRFAFALSVLPTAKTEGFRIAGSNNAGIQISQIQLKFCYFITVRNMIDLFPLGNRSGTYSQNDRPCCAARRSCGPIDCYLSILGRSRGTRGCSQSVSTCRVWISDYRTFPIHLPAPNWSVEQPRRNNVG